MQEGGRHEPSIAMTGCPSGGMVDAGDSKSPAARCAGSSPASGTTLFSVVDRKYNALKAKVVSGVRTFRRGSRLEPPSFRSQGHSLLALCAIPRCGFPTPARFLLRQQAQHVPGFAEPFCQFAWTVLLGRRVRPVWFDSVPPQHHETCVPRS